MYIYLHIAPLDNLIHGVSKLVFVQMNCMLKFSGTLLCAYSFTRLSHMFPFIRTMSLIHSRKQPPPFIRLRCVRAILLNFRDVRWQLFIFHYVFHSLKIPLLSCACTHAMSRNALRSKFSPFSS